jgi:NAD(P)-dependent dehydrogenase (short-subunit alcohol dehydrogenase family)
MVRAIAPGAFASQMNVDAPDHAEEIAARIPAKRIGADEDMAGSRAGDYIVGVTMDGRIVHASTGDFLLFPL